MLFNYLPSLCILPPLKCDSSKWEYNSAMFNWLAVISGFPPTPSAVWSVHINFPHLFQSTTVCKASFRQCFLKTFVFRLLLVELYEIIPIKLWPISVICSPGQKQWRSSNNRHPRKIMVFCLCHQSAQARLVQKIGSQKYFTKWTWGISVHYHISFTFCHKSIPYW